MRIISGYTITFKTIKLLLRIDTAKERILLIFSPESLSSLREAERLFVTKTLETKKNPSNLSSYSPWKTHIPPSSYAGKLTTCMQSIESSPPLKHSNFIKDKKTTKISPSTRLPFKGKNVIRKNFDEFSEGPAIDYIKTSFFERVALMFYKKYN